MDDTEEKECPYCYEVIDSRARKCPFCHQWQSNFFLTFYHPLFAAALFLVIITPFSYLFKEGVNEILDPGVDYSKHKDALKVRNISMSFGKDYDGNTVFTMGEIYNDSDLKWKDVSLEVLYYDKNGKRVDVIYDDVFWYNSAILPKSRVSFKVSSPMEREKEVYFTSNVNVVHAKDGTKKW